MYCLPLTFIVIVTNGSDDLPSNSKAEETALIESKQTTANIQKAPGKRRYDNYFNYYLEFISIYLYSEMR